MGRFFFFRALHSSPICMRLARRPSAARSAPRRPGPRPVAIATGDGLQRKRAALFKHSRANQAAPSWDRGGATVPRFKLDGAICRPRMALRRGDERLASRARAGRVVFRDQGKISGNATIRYFFHAPFSFRWSIYSGEVWDVFFFFFFQI